MIEAVFVPREDLRRALAQAFGREMAGYAATRVDGQFSCRRWTLRRRLLCTLPPVAVMVLCACLPGLGFAFLALLATFSLLMFAGLRLVGLLSQANDDHFCRRHRRRHPAAASAPAFAQGLDAGAPV